MSTSTSRPRRLAQAIDPSAQRYGDTAQLYDDYLNGRYDENYRSRTEQWQEHFEAMRARYNGHILRLAQTVPLNEMNVAIIGPGMHPVGRDLGNTAVQEILPDVQRLVIGDFSTLVVRKAIEDLHKGVSKIEKKTLALQWDLTDGFSTAYQRLIERRLAGVETEDQFDKAAEELDELDMHALREELKEILLQVDDEIMESGSFNDSLPDVFIGGGRNDPLERTLALSEVNGDAFPVHSWYLPMVLAGTGAAAEDIIWTRHGDVIATPENRGGKPNTEDVKGVRRATISRLYHLISRYNTIISMESIAKILQDNPESQVLAVCDLTTQLPEGFGEHDRIDVSLLAKELRKRGIGLTKSKYKHVWDDQPEHSHEVGALSFSRIDTSSTSSTETT